MDLKIEFTSSRSKRSEKFLVKRLNPASKKKAKG